jgi:hypothetical protein
MQKFRAQKSTGIGMFNGPAGLATMPMMGMSAAEANTSMGLSARVDMMAASKSLSNALGHKIRLFRPYMKIHTGGSPFPQQKTKKEHSRVTLEAITIMLSAG